MNLDALEYAMIWFESQEEPGAQPKVTYPDYTQAGGPDISQPPVQDFPYCCVRMPLQIQTRYYKRRPDGGYGSRDVIAEGESGAPDDLVCALIRGTKDEPPMSASNALIVASQLCERCTNALAHRYLLAWGYPEFSEPWKKARTSCAACAGSTPPIPPR